MRVRDDQKMAIEAYKTLYEGSVIFGIRKATEAAKGMPELEKRLVEIKHKRNVLQNKVIILKSCFSYFLSRKNYLQINYRIWSNLLRKLISMSRRRGSRR